MVTIHNKIEPQTQSKIGRRLAHLFCFSLLCLSLLHAITTMANTQASHQAALLMALSDLNRQMDGLSGSLINAVQHTNPQSAPLTPQLKSALIEAIQASFAPEKLKKNLLHRLDKGLKTEEIETLLAWYRSDLGRQIVSLEAKASLPGAMQEMMAQASALMANPKLTAHSQQIDNIVGASKLGVRLQYLTQKTLFQALSQDASVGKTSNANSTQTNHALTAAHFDVQWAAQASQIQATHKQLAILTFSYNYQTLTTEALNAHMQFLSTEEAIKFNALATSSIEQLFLTATQEMLNYLAADPTQDRLLEQLLHQR